MPVDDSVMVCDGPALLRLLSGAARRLQQDAPAINALNVFPVPDGDTGTNMVLTLGTALEAGGLRLERAGEAGAGEVAQAVAQGALMGARGNSGVILSQMLRGFAKSLEGCRCLDGPTLVAALRSAATGGYAGVASPVEGTMLTVIREAAEAVERLDSPAVERVLEVALAAARASLARTPELLPVLREAGVVDAGGRGIVAILEGALVTARGDDPGGAGPPHEAQAIDARWLAQAHGRIEADGLEYGYCTEFLLRGEGLNLERVRAAMEALGNSVLVVGDEGLVRVHLHTLDPGSALSCATGQGSLLQVKVENMQEQHQAFLAGHTRIAAAGGPPLPAAPATSSRVGVVAVAPGPGWAEVFRSLGATVVPGGQTMNPSAGDLLAAIIQSGSESVIVLPNNPNIIGAARQAAELSERPVAVVPSRTAPQGIAALMALSPEAGLAEAERSMAAAMGPVRTIEVTRGVRDVTLDGVLVHKGQAIALVDERLVAAAGTPEDAVLTALRHLDFTPALLTVYYGDSVTPSDAQSLAEQLRTAVPGAEVEVINGKQPYYPFIVAVEG